MRQRTRHAAGSLACCAALLGTSAATTAPAPGAAPAAAAHGHDPARGTLPAGDGWAAADGGTTGGAAAGRENVRTVRTWDQFRAALAAGGGEPQIIRVAGTIDAQAAGCAAYEAPGYDFDTYLADYDPAVWGHDTPVSGPQEDARAASAARQAAAITAHVPSDTTVVGVGRNAGITGAGLRIEDADNVIVRNLTLESPLDCFPQWDPTDGDRGAWNSEYDAAVVHNSTHVWLDHNTFTDGRHPDSSLPSHYGELYQQHDGELDVVRGADLVTVSWNVFEEHAKTLMIGNSDAAGDTDRGRLRVTLHHNLFRGVGERAPRVRFGQVDTYNNHYVITDGSYSYSFGIGFESRLVAEKNSFRLPPGTGPDRILKKWSEAPLTADHNLVNGTRTDLVAAHNAANPDTPLQRDAGWTPKLRTRVDDPRAVPGVVVPRAGAGRLR